MVEADSLGLDTVRMETAALAPPHNIETAMNIVAQVSLIHSHYRGQEVILFPLTGQFQRGCGLSGHCGASALYPVAEVGRQDRECA